MLYWYETTKKSLYNLFNVVQSCIKCYFNKVKMIKILLIDCSRSLDQDQRDVYDVHHPPVGLVALATHINKSDLGKHTNFKIVDSTMDYNTLQ